MTRLVALLLLAAAAATATAPLPLEAAPPPSSSALPLRSRKEVREMTCGEWERFGALRWSAGGWCSRKSCV